MSIRTVGLITYHHPHLKTEQVLQRLLHKNYQYKMYSLPFKRFKPRDTVINHRPNQSEAVAPHILADKHSIPYSICQSDKDIDDSCDIYLVLGAGILSGDCVTGKRIVNCHPGILPACRGLDSFKWAIYEMKPLGVTLHYIDTDVDAGETIAIVPTNVYIEDSLMTLARRHYENEIALLGNFDELIGNSPYSFPDMLADEPKRRMTLSKERELTQMFSAYCDRYGS